VDHTTGCVERAPGGRGFPYADARAGDVRIARMRTTPRALRVVPLFFAVAMLLLAIPSEASANRFRPVYVGFGGGLYADFDCCAIHGRVSGEFGWHFGGEDTGFVMAVEAIGTFGPNFWMFLGGLRLGGDIEVHGDRHVAIMLRPSGLFGVAGRDYDGDGHGVFGYLVLQPAFDIRFAVAERVVVFWLRPVAFDILFQWDRSPRGDWYASAAYQAMGGIDFQF
jgi:hypothetical protein